MKIKKFFTKISQQVKRFKVTKIVIKTHFIDVQLVPVKITYKCSYKKEKNQAKCLIFYCPHLEFGTQSSV